MITNKNFTFALFLSIFFLLLLEHADARIAVGLVWSTESGSIEEDSIYCATYGAYNPMDEDVDVALVIGGELTQVVQSQESKPVTVKAGTSYQDAIDLDACFYVPRVYGRNCILGL